MEQRWQDTVQQLLVGTRRGNVDRDTLLADCAALGVARFGARLPMTPDNLTPVPLAPPENAQLAGESVRTVLAQVLGWDDEALLTEWCAAASRSRVVAAHAQLPQLLALGGARPTLRPAIRLVLGMRGQWLAQLSKDWGWAVGAKDQEEYDPTATAGKRLTALRQWRRTDPAAVRELAAERYPEERRTTDRQLWIHALEVNLAIEDEPLLELALDDRVAAVHDFALRMLRRIPGTALAQRAERRLWDGLRDADVIPDGRFELEPDAAERRDLLHDGNTETGIAGRLRAAAASVPPEFWDLDQVVASPWAKPLLQGIADALPLAADPVPWALAASEVLTGMALLDAIDSLPARTASEVLVAVSHDWKYDLLDHGCSQLPGPWSAGTTEALLERFVVAVTPGWRTGRPPPVLLTRGDVGVLTEQWPRIAERWPEHTNEQAVLHLRVQLRDAFDRRGDQ
ncbi:DUF5691 domain-containing protein [Kutzneria sp. NPDC051319]|uniref:DUF5691 domain-containing protein n=1 Tax=Kutzneria sp. NPDC051319 TaxID=3155047 RepID=UPI0034298AC7